MMGFGDDPPEPEVQEERLADDQPGIEALACVLAELMAAAQTRVDGAAVLVGRSADEAQAYRDAIASEAEAIDMTGLPANAASALIEVTRSMIERTRAAEERLRAMGEELSVLQQDLTEARACAERDPLTGLPNRRALEAALAHAVTGARNLNAALSLAFCDVDHFKQINDRHGHALGDRVLRMIADCLSDGAGDNVFVGRQGGEEFVMLFEGVGAEDAAIRVDAIRARLASRTLRSRTDDQPIGTVTFSAGVAMLAEDEGGDGLMRRADNALYRAKRSGRNRVEIDRNG